MEIMRRKIGIVLAVAIGVGMSLSLAQTLWAQDDDEGPSANMHFLVVRDYNGKPVKNAAVVLHPVNKKGKQQRGGLELKTDSEGKTGIDGIPYGPLRIQVLVPGFQTFGQDYLVNKAEMEIVVKLKKPAGQYSIYENHPEEKKPEEKKPDDNKPDDKPPADKAPAEAKPQS